MSTLTAYKLNGIPSTLSLIQIPAGHDFRVEGTIDMTNDGALQLPQVLLEKDQVVLVQDIQDGIQLLRKLKRGLVHSGLI